MNEDFGKYIRDLRKSKKITLVELAERTGLSQPYLSQIENNKRGKKPTVDVINTLAKGLDVSNAELLKQAGLLERLDHEANVVKFGILIDNYLVEQEKFHLDAINSFCKNFIELYEAGNPNALGWAKNIAEKVNEIHDLKKTHEQVRKATQDELTGFELIDE